MMQPDSLSGSTFGEIDALVDAMHGEDGWWSTSARTAYQMAGRQLVMMGMKPEAAADFLKRLYYAAASEYGD